ncbi:MAG: hypothetical protein EZS28_015607 [Streblomastix strix]|uniref:Uncharacterized protein n=1 Tax=Streblomastix strix TaxID=222440 RepID=A0A5J4W1M3_9EUKA|nr:MAG: hypothetical protein EZS28_015607 [Streblomastix strix]
MNSSYGSDGMNQERFSQIKISERNETFRAHLKNIFNADRKLNENVYAVEFEKLKFNCNTCIQVPFAIQDCSKYWIMNFYQDFLCRCFDQNRFNYVYGNTDSLMLAVAGDPNQDYTQGFSAIVSDKQFYDENFFKFFLDPSKDVYDEKKLLDVAYDHCSSSIIALAPKNYWFLEDFDKTNPETVKLKVLNLNSNPQINKQAYEENIKNGTVVKGKNLSLRQRAGETNQIEVLKNGISECHTKMVTLPNQCCCLFIYQFTADSSKRQELQ